MQKRFQFPSVVVSIVVIGAWMHHGMTSRISWMEQNHTGDLETTQQLIASGADLNHSAEFGSTPLMQSARSGDIAAVDALLAKHVDVNATDVSGRTALNWAIHMYSISQNECYNAVAKSLIDHGTDLSHKNRMGRTYLMSAIASGDPKLAQILIAHAVDLNATDTRGNTALMYAMAGELPPKYACPLCENLVAKGANTGARNILDRTAYDLSQAQPNVAIKKEGARLLAPKVHPTL